MTGQKFLENVVKGTPIGNIKLFVKGEGEEATEKFFSAFTGTELADFFGKTLSAWFKLGEYWYAVI